VEGVSKTLKKILIEKGYTNVLSVLKATPEELKFLLSLDDEAVNKLLEKLKPAEPAPTEEDNVVQ
jgi:hypothetical protein